MTLGIQISQAKPQGGEHGSISPVAWARNANCTKIPAHARASATASWWLSNSTPKCWGNYRQPMAGDPQFAARDAAREQANFQWGTGVPVAWQARENAVKSNWALCATNTWSAT